MIVNALLFHYVSASLWFGRIFLKIKQKNFRFIKKKIYYEKDSIMYIII